VSQFRSLEEACEDFKRHITFEEDGARMLPILVAAFWSGVVAVSDVTAVAALKGIKGK
jgi:hypothetical protein